MGSKVFLKFLLIIFGLALLGVLITNIVSFNSSLYETASRIEYQKVQDGLYSEYIVVVAGWQFQGPSVSLAGKCNCSHKFRGSTDERPCTMIPFEYTGSGAGSSLGLDNGTFYVSILIGPRNYRLGEYVALACVTNSSSSFSVVALPLSFEHLFKILSQPGEALSEFYDTHFITRPRLYIRNGHRTLLLLRKEVYQKVDEEANEENTFMKIESSRTKTDINNTYSSIILTWDTDLILQVQEVKTGNYWEYFKLVATGLLAFERFTAMYARFNRWSQN